ncbi:MAG: DUF1080 domain-containing protein [Pirellulales bacterium]
MLLSRLDGVVARFVPSQISDLRWMAARRGLVWTLLWSGFLIAVSSAQVRADEPKPAAKAEQADSEGWIDLFDGKSFDGWEGNLDWFRIEDGCIVAGKLQGDIPRNEFLATREKYGDFELRLQIKAIGEGVNAGIQFRTARIPNHHEVSGYQADVGSGWWGKLYDESRRNRILAGDDKTAPESIVRKGDWNDYRIVCQGKRIQLYLNDHKTVDYTETDPDIATDGIIAVQIHGGPPSEAWYRNIQLRPLKPVSR